MSNKSYFNFYALISCNPFRVYRGLKQIIVALSLVGFSGMGSLAYAALPLSEPVTTGLHLTSFEIDGDKDNDSTFTGSASGVSGDWEDSTESDLPGAGFYANGLTPADAAVDLDAETVGIYYSKRNHDANLCIDGDTDDDIIPSDPGDNVKVDDGPNWPVALGNVPGKDDLVDVWVALETVRLKTLTTDQVNYILYIAFERCSGTGGAMSAVVFLENGDGVLPSDGPGMVANPAFPLTDLLFEFDVAGTGSPSNQITQYTRNAANTAWENPVAINSPFYDIASNGNNPTFGEIGIDLTAAGIVPEDQCVNLSIEGSVATIAGGSISSDPKDIVLVEPALIQNCAPLIVNKVSNPAGLNVAEEFTYVVDQEDGLASHGLLQGEVSIDLAVTGNSVAATEPDADQTEIDQIITVGETHNWVNVIAEPDYQLDETILPISGDWALENIECTWYDPFAATLNTDVEVHDGTAITGQFIIPSPGFNGGQTTICTITNATTALDYGDAPDTYGTLVASSGPMHFTGGTAPFLGAIPPDDEADGIPATAPAAADGDDTTGIADEDATVITPTYDGLGSYQAGVSFSNPTTEPAVLVAWIDWGTDAATPDGTFVAASDRSIADVAIFTPVGTCVSSITSDGTFVSGNIPAGCSGLAALTWDSVPLIGAVAASSLTTYLRARITTDVNSGFFSDSSPTPSGGAGNGEIEDSLIVISTTPVTLSSFSSERINGNRLQIDWGTSSEVSNAGFQLMGLDGISGEWVNLHDRLIESGNGNSVEPQVYSQKVKVPKAIQSLAAVGISSTDGDGSQHYYGPFEVGASFGEQSTIEAINWSEINSATTSSLLGQGYEEVGDSQFRSVESASSVEDSDSFVELIIDRAGMYRLTASDLPSTGGINWADIANGDLAVVDNSGNPVSRYVVAKGKGRGDAKKLGSSGEVYFFGQLPDGDAAIYSHRSVYRLMANSSKVLPAQTQSKQRVKNGFSSSYREQSVVEDDDIYHMFSAVDDPWFAAHFLSYPNSARGYAVSVPVEVDALSNSAKLLIGAGKVSGLANVDADNNGVQDPEHIAQGAILTAGGSLVTLDSQSSVGKGLWNLEFEIPDLSAVVSDDGTVNAGGLFNAGAGYAYSWLNIDHVGIEYSRPYVAKHNQSHLEFDGPNEGELGYEVVVPDKGAVAVFAIDGGNLTNLSAESIKTFTDENGVNQQKVRIATLQGTDDSAHYWVSSKSEFLTPADIAGRSISKQSALLTQAQGANYLIISHPDFTSSNFLSDFVNHKQQQHVVAVVNYLEIVDIFGGGQTGPQGLTRYLSAVEAQQEIDYVLLVGGGTYDHTDNLELGAVTFIPANYRHGSFATYTPTDQPYVTDETSGEIWASIGRWPVRTEEELAVIVAKTMQWDADNHQAGQSLLIAENTKANEGINFGSALETMAPIIPDDWRVDRVFVDDVINSETPNLSLGAAIARSKQQIKDNLNAHPDLVIYDGHGSSSQLTFTGLFNLSDVSDITSGGSEMWLPLSCYVTYYESTHVNSLAHQLMFTGNAVNITGAVSLSSQGDNLLMGHLLLDGLFNQNRSIGESVKVANRQLGDVRQSNNMMLLGDPSISMGASQ